MCDALVVGMLVCGVVVVVRGGMVLWWSLGARYYSHVLSLHNKLLFHYLVFLQHTVQRTRA